MHPSVLTAAIVATCLKVTLLPSYRSTDFEVHRNWLALTHSLPVASWYYDNTSIWTLDYPPLFAYFELLLSYPASAADPNITRLDSLNYASDTCVTFQRLSVVASDLILIIATSCYVSTLTQRAACRTSALSLLLICNPSLLVVDHMHFQYNGMLLGILLLSLVAMKRGRYVTAAALFTVLLHLKHIFIYLAPSYFVFLLTNYCLHTAHSKHSFLRVATTRLCLLAFTVLSISFFSLLAFLPHLSQLIARLFPFKRGLTHAYWAPNIWAIYNSADLVLSKILSHSDTSSTRGLVGEVTHLVLPSPTPLFTLVCTVVAMIPALLVGMRSSNKAHQFDRFVTSLTLCGLASFMCGWHVHEKAILLVLIPLSLLAVEHGTVGTIYTLLSTSGLFSLFPLLHQLREAPIKICLLILNFSACQLILPSCVDKWQPLNRWALLYLSGLLPLVALDVLGAGERYQFLPLLVTSLYCSLGNVYSWQKLSRFATNLT